MEIFPAIDIKDGKVVRLFRGDYGKVTNYDCSPAQAALAFKRGGASNLHIVDLDGAKDGAAANFGVIEALVKTAGMFTQVGGGIRDEARIVKYLSAGADRVILGTAAVNDFQFLSEMIKKYGPRIAVGVDVKDGFAATDGWLTVTRTDGPQLCRRVRDVGAQTVIFTDISRDGAESGANTQIYGKLAEIDGLNIIASGGISFLREIKALRAIGVGGAIIGKALYSGALSLSEVLEAAAC